MNPDALIASRVLMGDSLGFHIIFVMFGLTLPILVSLFEFIGIRRNDAAYIATARKWSKVMSILVIAGVISGTIIALQMTLVWPGILQFGGEVIGLPFMFETYAFLIEAVFLALYMLTWNSKRVKPWLHWLFGLFIILGSTMSAYAITSVNGWMNLPTGFTIVDGTFQNIDVFKAMFSEVALVEFFHSMFGYYLAASLAIAGLYLFKVSSMKPSDRLRKNAAFDWIIIQKLMIIAVIALIGSTVTADLTGKYLAKHEPAKLATIELVEKTESNVPFIFGGIEGANGEITGPYIKIPNALSILAGGSSTTQITGIQDIPQDERPPSYIRALFNIKLTLIGVLVGAIIGYFALRRLRPELLARSVLLKGMGLIFFLGIVIMELGWMLTEIGRQPWAVRGYVTTAEAVTKTHDITSFGYFFPLSFIVLGILTIYAVKKVVSADTKKKRKST